MGARGVAAAVFIALCLVAAGAKAAELGGRVTWPDGRPAIGATVSIRAYSVGTDRQGLYRFSQLRPGRYTLTIGYGGKPSRTFQVRVEEGRSNVHDVVISW